MTTPHPAYRSPMTLEPATLEGMPRPARGRQKRKPDGVNPLEKASRLGTHFQPLPEGWIIKPHNVSHTPETHAAFAELNPRERGELIAAALEARKAQG
ncbi:MAG: hypothetical protein HC933_18590 [Pleurocapsa sp. SU_196_0]|nr:hypothetical protein [Pleurocapsa sp. SU_196_0]